MRKIVLPFLALSTVLIALSLTGCDPYKKLAKSNSIADKDSAAVYYYNHKKYDRAVYIFEELMAIYRGTPRMEEMYYYYAWCKYFLGELVSAAYYFDDFAQKFPGSKHGEEFEYMTAKCYYQISDPYYLDQKYTLKAINQFQLFLSRHPQAERREQCQKYLTELRERLAKKAFEQASLYHNIGYHKAAVVAFQIMVDEYSDSKFREEAQFLLLKSCVNLADVSVSSKKLERYEEAAEYFEKFEDKFPGGKFAKEAEALRDHIEKMQAKLIAERKKDEEKAAFDAFKHSMSVVMDANDDDIRKAEYAKAMDSYRLFKEKYPESEYLSNADKIFRQFENKFKE